MTSHTSEIGAGIRAEMRGWFLAQNIPSGQMPGAMMQMNKSDKYQSHQGISPERMSAISQMSATKFKALYATASNRDFEKSRRSDGTNKS
jgi:hypothetical protein